MPHSLRKLRRQCLIGALGVCYLSAGSGAARAQATAGSFLGRVTDISRAVVPRAVVTAVNAATGLTETRQTDAVGEYLIGPLPPGTYTLQVTKENFSAIVMRDVNLSIDQKVEIEFELRVSPVAQLAVVTAPTPMLETQSAETGAVFGSRQVQDLPLLGRNFLELSRLTTGVVSGSGGNTLNVSVAGQREFANSILVDGVEVSSNRNNDTSLRPSVDAVEEFKMVTSSYSAEFGSAAGGVIAIQTASGTNRLHGELYEYYRPSNTAARSFFAPSGSPLKQHNFGGTAGGPLRKNKTFWFSSYEWTRMRNAFSYLDSVPPAGQIHYLPGGDVDLSGLMDPSTGKQIPIFDPAAYATNYSATQFPGNIIPASRISPAGRAILQNFFPAPTGVGLMHGWFDNFVSNQAYLYDGDCVDGRVDHIFSERDRIAGAYHYSSFLSTTGDRFAGWIPVAGGGDADYGDHESARSQTLSLAEIHTLSANAVNEVRFGYTRYRLNQLSLLNGQDLSQQFGLGNVTLPGYPQTYGFPDIYLGFGAQTGGSTFKPLYFLDSNYQVSETVSARKGRHDFKTGVQYRRLSSNPFFSLFPTGFQFYGGPGLSLTGDPSYSFYDAKAFYYNGGSDIADLLLGLPYSVNLGLQLTNPSTRSWETNVYAQDAWRVSEGLTFLYGVRYEYFNPWTESRNQAANFNPMTQQILPAGRGGNSAALVQPDRNNFAPRLGLAYRVAERTVVRAGWGIFYTPENDAREDILTKNYPFATQQNVFNSLYGGLPFSYNLSTGVARLTPAPPVNGGSSIDPATVRSLTGTSQNIYMIDANLRTGYSQAYNLTLQKEIASHMTVEAGYIGALGRELPYAVGNINRGNTLSQSLGQIQALYSEGSSSFQSLQVKAVKQWTRGQMLMASYTFGKNMDNGPAPFNLGHNQNSLNQPQDPLNLAVERAPADNDVTHNLVMSDVYELPFGRGRQFLTELSGWRQALLGGWQVNGIWTAHSGLPVNVVRNVQDTGFEGLRPNVVRDPNLSEAQRTLARYFDTSAFIASAFTGAQKHALGNAGRNLVRGPGLVNLDVSAFKQFRLRENTNLQVRFEFFNVSNTPHFASPNGNMSQGSFGSITQTIGNPRVAQFAAKLRF